MIEILLFMATVILFFGGYTSTFKLNVPLEIGRFFAQSSVILLSLVLLPGITRRLKKGLIIHRTLMPFRRHIGILMFLTAWSHSSLNHILPRLLIGNLFSLPPLFVIWGMIALSLAVPLFITSNDYSVRLLKRNWARVHKLAYILPIMVLAHIALQQSLLSIVAAVTLVLLIASFFVSKNSSQNQTLKETPPPTQNIGNNQP
jgi:sulfoxide reductase heme-binding subunit YedZ